MDEIKKEIECPSCGKLIEKNNKDGNYYCESCDKTFGKRAKCDICGEDLEKLQACGATNFFCNKCNSLKSKKDVIYFIKEL